MNITTVISSRPLDDGTHQIIVRRPDGEGVEPILLVPDAARAAHALAAVRRAYAFGRRDERRQTQAVLRGLMGRD